MNERYNPAALLEAKKTLGKESKPVLTEEFAIRVNDHLGNLEDDVELTFFAPWVQMVGYLARKEGRVITPPTEEFTDFMESISFQERVQFKRIVDRAYHVFDVRTMGDMRKLVDQTPTYFWRMGTRGRAFASVAFQRKPQQTEMVAENLTLGL